MSLKVESMNHNGSFISEPLRNAVFLVQTMAHREAQEHLTRYGTITDSSRLQVYVIKKPLNCK